MSCLSLRPRYTTGRREKDVSSIFSDSPLLGECEKQDEKSVQPLDTSDRITELRKLMAEEGVSAAMIFSYVDSNSQS